MKKFTFAFLTAALAAMTLTACFGGSTSEPTRYFTLAVENIDMPNAGDASGRLQVRKFTIDQAYQRNNIVYRESAYDFMFYDLDLWASRPDSWATSKPSKKLTKVPRSMHAFPSSSRSRNPTPTPPSGKSALTKGSL